jgi:hypothetical protein
MPQWLEWGVLISGSTGWVHYSSLALSNLVVGPKDFRKTALEPQ